jgi:hypothetical protein
VADEPVGEDHDQVDLPVALAGDDERADGERSGFESGILGCGWTGTEVGDLPAAV